MGAGSARLGRLVLGAIVTLMLAGSMLLVLQNEGRAQRDPYSEKEPRVKPTLIVQNTMPEPRGEIVRRDDPLLPFTGGDVTMFLIAGVAAISVGTVLVRARRRTE